MKKKKSDFGYIRMMVSFLGLCAAFICCNACAREDNVSVLLEEVSDGEQIQEETSQESEKENDAVIYAQIDGAVVSPGVYELPKGSRVFVLVELAGGLTQEASSKSINQALMLEDGQQLYVPTKQEVLFAEEEVALQEEGKVNLNTATKQQLMTLPGVGESKAESIIKYREEIGKFSSIDEIMNVNGIKQGIYENMKDFITI